MVSNLKKIAVCIVCVVIFTWINLINTKTMLKSKRETKLKYILLWPTQPYPFSEILQGREEFVRLNCPVNNCFITNNSALFHDIRRFDAIIFSGVRPLYNGRPVSRSQHQIYLYFSMESSLNYPLMDKIYDGFFNWTATYRLDSEIPVPYLLIKDKNGNVVGPKIDMHWVPEEEVDEEIAANNTFKHKSRAAAIFYSNCLSASRREELIQELRRELVNTGLTVDVFGACGLYSCPRTNSVICDRMLEHDYYFYLSYENSLDQDYVTEKLLRPVQCNVIPVVFGGANYSRFLPPRSYLDSSKMSSWRIAQEMAELIASTEKYLQYFWWKKYYTYHDPKRNENICNICAAINNETLLKTSKIYENFREWWNKNIQF